MGVDWDETRCSNEVLPRSKVDMFAALFIEPGTCESKVDHVDDVGGLADSHHNVVRLDVSMYDATNVHQLDSLQYLLENHETGLERELSPAEVEEILKSWPH